MTDQIKKFMLEDRSARVSAVEMQHVWHEAISRHQYPEAVQALLGELMCAAALLASSLKFDGSMLLQLQGQGPIRLLVVECRADMSMRATVKLGSTPFTDQAGLLELINPDGQGQFAVILNPPKDAIDVHPYQGIVPLEADNVAQAIEQYMEQSEQLTTRLWLATSDNRIGGLLLQRMPTTGGTAIADDEQAQASWQEAQIVCETIRKEELVSLSSDELLARLFWERPVLSLETKPIHWDCGCTRERVESMLQSLGKNEVQEILDTEGQVEITCEFCGERYEFNQEEAMQIFSDDNKPNDLSSNTIH